MPTIRIRHTVALRFVARRLVSVDREARDQLRETIGKPDDPSIREPRGSPHPGVGVGSDPDRWPRLLERARCDRDIVDLEEFAVVRELLVLPCELHDFEALGHEPAALVKRQSKRLVLVGSIAQTGSEDRSPSRQDVERLELLGHIQRIGQRQQEDARTEAQVLRARGDRRQDDPRMLREPEAGRETVMAHEETCETKVFSMHSRAQDRFWLAAWVEHTEVHRERHFRASK
jgi:hypothetical protein